MPRGGFRPGAGKPKGSKDKKTLEKELFRKRFMEKMQDEWDEIIESQVRLAKGVLVQDAEGEPVYRKPPDGQTGKNLLEQTMGKPVQPVEGSGENGEFIFQWQK